MGEHHIFAAIPASGGLGANVARSLAQGRGLLAQAGYGAPVLGPIASGGVHVDETIFAKPIAGLSGFFTHIQRRARHFSSNLSTPVGRLVLPVVAYDDYFPALWRHQAQRRAVEDFATLAPELAALRRGWVEIVRELIAALSPREVVILPAPTGVAEVLTALVPGAAIEARPGQGREMPDTALAMLQRLYRSGVEISPQQVARLTAFHARQPQPAPIAAFAPLEGALLRRRFQRDLATLAAMPGVRIGLAESAPERFAIAAE
ncbi:MAG: hypothetical protein AB7U46_07880 [Paenirhodobacter sp.]|uniref:hypothetical protein n=1 Tax=Paenirhodobacter sp. TaxID=1965326 RepID=UPI003D0D7933